PARSERTILSKMVSTTTSLSLRVNSTRPETSSIRSALVMVTLLSNSSRYFHRGGPWVRWLHPRPVNCRPHNLLKFQGLLARARCDHRLATSKDSKTQPADRATSPLWADMELRHRIASRAKIYGRAQGAPAPVLRLC